MALRDGFLGIGHEWDVGHKAGIGDARREPGLVDLEPLLVVPRGHGLLVYRLPGRYPALLGGTCNVWIYNLIHAYIGYTTK